MIIPFFVIGIGDRWGALSMIGTHGGTVVRSNRLELVKYHRSVNLRWRNSATPIFRGGQRSGRNPQRNPFRNSLRISCQSTNPPKQLFTPLIKMSPIATTDVSLTAKPRKPRVFSLEPLHSRALTLAREKFELVLPTDPGFAEWRVRAEGLLARNAEVTAEDTRTLKENKLRYIAKQGVGVDNFDLDELKRCGIPLMNTPGVNVSQVACLAY